jgi:dUTP pyrophosphatase
MKVRIKKLDEKAVIPQYAKDGDAGLDLVATSKIYDKYGNVSYGVGLAIEIPKGYVGLLFPRSSICKNDLSLTNSVGVIDSGYRGEIFFKFKPALNYVNYVPDDFQLTPENGEDDTDFDAIALPSPETYAEYQVGDKIGQLIIMPYPQIELEESAELSDTDRGEGGFGSSGA